LRGYGQRDPLNEYKTEGFNLFEAMISKLRETATAQVMRVEIQSQAPGEMLPDEDDLPFMEAHHIDASSGEDDVGEGFPIFGQATATAAATLDPKRPETWGKVARNEPCPCGSGKKYKHCHGAFV
jgi:preprotein translocase subunit SecA